MEAKLTFKYDREADILHIDKTLPYAAQDSEEVGDGVIARMNPASGEIENLEVLFFFPRGSCGRTYLNYRSRQIFVWP